MSFKINNVKILQNDQDAIISLNITNTQIVRGDIIIEGDGKSNLDLPLNILFQNNIKHIIFKTGLINYPLTSNSILMFDLCGNNIGKFTKDRTNNIGGGTLEYISNTPDFLHQYNIPLGEQNILIMTNYEALNLAYSNKVKNKIINYDIEKSGNKFKTTRLFIIKELYDKITDIVKDDFINIFQDINIYEKDIVNMCMESLFGKLIKGIPTHFTKFIYFQNCEINCILSDTKNCEIINRTNNRIQFNSKTKDSICTLLVIISNIKTLSIIINTDEIEIPVKEPLDITDTPDLDYIFYSNFFKLKNVLNKLNNTKDLIKELITNSKLVLTYCLKQEKKLKKSENILQNIIVNLYNLNLQDIKNMVINNINNLENNIIPYFSKLQTINKTNGFCTSQLSTIKSKN